MAKIHCILLLKNDEDIIELCLREAAKWAHKIYIYDGASTDGTWEIVQRMASDVIIPWKSEDKVFQEYLRLEVFNAFLDSVPPGDWWCQLNSDEFYVESPALFLDRIPRASQVVWGNYIEYYLTDKDVGTVNFNQPMEEVLKALHYYRCICSERRFFKHRRNLQWGPTDAWPRHLGIVERERITFRHYPYRTPQQIQARLDRRRESRRKGFQGGDHDNYERWQDKVMDHRFLRYDDGSPIVIDESQVPQHRSAWPQRALQYVMHQTGLWT
jgi:glycosyltransferase involved in cell wall biosynthesis